MLTVYNCIVNDHDFRLVGLAALICTLASFTAMTLLRHVRRSDGGLRAAWLLVAATATGFGIAAIHYTGMAAFEIAGRIEWDPALVAVSIGLGALLGAVALFVGLRGSGMKPRIYGALLLTVAICSHHFTAMGAAAITPDP